MGALKILKMATSLVDWMILRDNELRLVLIERGRQQPFNEEEGFEFHFINL